MKSAMTSEAWAEWVALGAQEESAARAARLRPRERFPQVPPQLTLDPALESGGIAVSGGARKLGPLPPQGLQGFMQLAISSHAIQSKRLPIECVGGIAGLGKAGRNLREEIRCRAILTAVQEVPGQTIDRVRRIPDQPGLGYSRIGLGGCGERGSGKIWKHG
jgi:hypothetical protein